MKRMIALLLAFCLCLSGMALTAQALLTASDPESGDQANSWRYGQGKLPFEQQPNSPLAEASHPDATLLGIDVSEHQGQIDWEKVMADGIDFAILRVGYGMDQTDQDDKWFAYNVTECERVGMPYGVYIYSYATTVERASSEADHVLRLIEGHALSFPVYYDMEDNSTIGSDLAAIAKTFCNKISAAGYPVGVYANLNWWNNYLTDPCFDNWHRWVAQYNTSCHYTGEYAMWQYTSSGSVDGISGRVDMNFLIGYPADHNTAPAAHLRTNKDTYQVGEAILTTASSNVSGAWVAVYGADDAISSSLPSYYWYYVSGNGAEYGRGDQVWVSGGTYNIHDTICSNRNGVSGTLPAGKYKVVILHGDYELLTQKQITIVETTSTETSLATDKSIYFEGEDILVSAVSYKPGAWVGIYAGEKTSGFGSDYIYYYYTSGRNGAAVAIRKQTANGGSAYLGLPEGTYTIVLFGDSGYDNVEKTVTVSVTAAGIITDKTEYHIGDPILVTTNYTGSGAWIGLYKQGEQPGEGAGTSKSIFWYYISEENATTDILKTRDENSRGGEYGPGNFTVVLFSNSGFTVKDRIDITVTDHTYEAAVTDPTCDSDGFTVYTCSVCGDSHKDDYVDAYGHSYGDWQTITEPSCTATGEKQRTCGVCGDVQSEKIDVTAHDYERKVTLPTCTEKGYTTYTCENCGDSYTSGSMNPLGHSYKSVVTPSTCTKQGYTTHTCSACGDSYMDTYTALGEHSYENGKCTVCGEQAPAPKAEVIRLAGADRFDTAFKAANELKTILGVEKFDSIVVASGAEFADALAGSYLAAVKEAPILLSFKQTQNEQVQVYIKENLAPGGTVYILGGTSAVPSSMEAGLQGLNVKRLAGANRFETNLLILKEAGVEAGDEILVCTGTEFADSLSASATGKPILLVYRNLTDGQIEYLKSLNGNKFCIVGGESAVPTALETAIKAYGTTTRLAGNNRLITSVMVAQKYFSNPDSAVVAYGWNFPDGLCGGPLAYAMDAPLILTYSKPSLYKVAADYTNPLGIQSGYVLGGTGLVYDEAVRTIFSMAAADEIILK